MEKKYINNNDNDKKSKIIIIEKHFKNIIV